MRAPKSRPRRPGLQGSEAESAMRVGLILQHYDVDRGGVERYADTLTRALLDAGHGVHVIASSATGLPEGALFHRVRARSFWSPVKTLSFAAGAGHVLDRERGSMDAVLGLTRARRQDVYRVGAGVYWAHLRSTKPWTANALGAALIRLSPRHAAFLAMDRWIMNGWRRGWTLRYLCNSRKVREEIITQYGVPPERIDVLHNPVDLVRFDPERERPAREETRRGLGIPPEVDVALFSGSGWHRKGLDAAIRAVASCRSRPWLLVAGSDDPGAHARLARSLGIDDRVVFAGLRADIARIYAASDLLLAPTRYDAFSNATAEALAMGLPVITTETNGAAELIAQGREGFVVARAGDVPALAEALDLLADAGLRKTMGAWARRRAESLSPAAYAEALIKILESAVAMRREGATPPGQDR